MSRPEVSEYINSPEERAFDLFTAGTIGSVSLAAASLVDGVVLALNGGIAPMFRQDRVGRGGDLFKVFKFRTWGYDGQKLKGADVLRSTGLDKSAQFINVLLGEMSVVGYRPISNRDINHAAQRLRTHYTEELPVSPK